MIKNATVDTPCTWDLPKCHICKIWQKWLFNYDSFVQTQNNIQNVTHKMWPTICDPHMVTHTWWPTHGDPHSVTQMGRRPRWEGDPDGKATQMGRQPRRDGDPDGKATQMGRRPDGKATQMGGWTCWQGDTLDTWLKNIVWKHVAAITFWVNPTKKHTTNLCRETYLFWF